MKLFQSTPILSGPPLYSFYAFSLLLVVLLVVRSLLLPPALRTSALRRLGGHADVPRPFRPRTWLALATSALVGGAIAGAVTIFVGRHILHVFGKPLSPVTEAWVISTFAAVALALANLWRSRWWRKAGAAVAVVVFAVTGVLGIDAGHQASLASSSPSKQHLPGQLTLPELDPSARKQADTALWRTWTPPAGMPTAGRTGTVAIPPLTSRFTARDAFVYLPPAALVANPPALPVLVMMMGQPGGPGQMKQAVSLLDALAKQHQGLGPIVVTVDQLGSTYRNPLCVNSTRGNVYTYVASDVVNYIRKSFNATSDRTGWAVGGYSNGGECALSFGAKRPDVFGSFLSISGELEPRDGSLANTIAKVFGGNTAAYDAEKPANILKTHKYPDELAIFTSGGRDKFYTSQAVTAQADADAAGIKTKRFVGAGVGHLGDAILFGLKAGLPLLYQRFGLVGQ